MITCTNMKANYQTSASNGTAQMQMDATVDKGGKGAGAAYLAGVSAGLWKPQDVLKIKKTERTFKPRMSRNVAKTKYDGWCHAVRQVLAP